jgi:HSP20 family protein
MAVQPQSVPVRIYDGDEHIVLAAPLPGVEAENISVTIAGSKVTIIGDERGPRQHERHVLVDEWSIGPYRREVSIPQAINGSLTNATYGNGVLVLSMPKRKEGEAASDTSFQLRPVAATRGERIGHTGSDIRPAHNAGT